MKSVRLAVCLLVLLVLVAPAAFGDKLHLKNGHTLEGELVRETATHYYFKIRGMGEQPIAKADVLRFEESKSVFDEYTERRKALKKDDAKGHYELGLWCKENSLRKEAKTEFEAAMAADPDHAGARDELGFARYEGEWITKEKRDEILAELAKQEGEVLAGLHLAEKVRNPKARFAFRPPKGWAAEVENEKTEFTWAGPTLRKAPITLTFVAEESGDDLDDFVKAVAKAIEREHEGAAQGEPKAAKLGGKDGKHLVFTYVRDDIAAEDLPMERHVVLAATDAGNFRFALECGEGVFPRLEPFFGKVLASFEILDKAPDILSEKYGFSMAFPDDTYVMTDNFPFKDQNENNLIPGDVLCVGSKSTSVLLIIVPGKKGDGRADPTSIQTLRDSIVNVAALPSFLQPAGGERELKVAGQDALAGAVSIMGGRFGGGRWCVFMKGDRYFRLFFLNLGNRMGTQYVDADFNKFLESFTFLD